MHVTHPVSPSPPARRAGIAQLAKARTSELLQRTLHRVSPLLLVQYRYRKATGRWFRSHHPVTFDEKLLWLMLYWHHPLKVECADKDSVREYVASRAGATLLPALYGVFDSPGDIDVHRLPDRFVLKATHGCGYNIFCRDRRRFDPEEAMRRLGRWMRTDQGRLYGEVHYSSIQPKVICEELLEDERGRPLNDYKFYCFHGEVHCAMACTDRTEAGAKYDFYDVEWRQKLPYSRSSLRANREIPRPAAYDRMIEAARVLSRPFPFVRVDMYSVGGRAVFGEMTFTPHGSIDPGLTEVAQRTMGELLHLPAPLPPGRSRTRENRKGRDWMSAAPGG